MAQNLTEAEIVQELRSALDENITGAKDPYASGGREYVIRCVYCGDSENLDNHHLYISMKPPFIWQCQRCNESGTVNYEFFKSYGIIDKSLTTLVESVNKEAFVEYAKTRSLGGSKHLLKFLNFGSTKKFNYEVSSPYADYIKKKMDYFNERLEVNYDINEFYKNKIILDLRNFFKVNNITRMNCDMDTMNKLHSDYIGFHSGTCGYITFRDAVKSDLGYRLYDYPLFWRGAEYTKYYWTPHTLNLLSPVLTLNLCEGVMDCIGLQHHIGKDTDSSATIAVCGKNFFNPILFFIKMGFLDIKINIFADEEVQVGFYKKWLRDNPILYKINTQVTVFYNTEANDYGHPSRLINLKQIRIK